MSRCVEAELEQSWLPLYVFPPRKPFLLPGSRSSQADELRNAPLLTKSNVSAIVLDEQNLPTWPSRQRFPEKATKGEATRAAPHNMNIEIISPEPVTKICQ